MTSAQKAPATKKFTGKPPLKPPAAFRMGAMTKAFCAAAPAWACSIVANKFKGVYASCCESVYAAKKCRIINDAHILCMGAFLVGGDMGVEMVKTFLGTSFTQDTDDALCGFLKQNAENVQKLEETLF